MAYKKSNPNGSATSANSEPVVIASDQSAVPVSGTVTANIGTVATLATAAKQDTLDTSVNTLLKPASTLSAVTTVGTITNVVQVGDNSGSLTVDAPVGTPAFVRLSDGTTAISTLPVSLASVPSHAVTNAGTFAVQATLAAETTKVIGTVNIASAQTIGITANSSVNVSQMNGVTTTMGAGASGTGTQRVVTATDSTIGTVTNLSQLGGTAISMNTGTRDTGTQRVTIATNDSVPVTGTFWQATQPVSGTVTANAGTGTMAVSLASVPSHAVTNAGTFAVQSAQSGTYTVQPGNTANTTPWLVTQTPTTSGGLTTYHLVSAATTNATSVKASAGQVYGWYIYNSNAAARKVAFHNTAGTPTAGASVLFSLVIPPTSGANVFAPSGMAFSTGIGITTTTGLADSDSAAVAANDLIINLFYK